jgi:hypothetical protein
VLFFYFLIKKNAGKYAGSDEWLKKVKAISQIFIFFGLPSGRVRTRCLAARVEMALALSALEKPSRV